MDSRYYRTNLYKTSHFLFFFKRKQFLCLDWILNKGAYSIMMWLNLIVIQYYYCIKNN